MFDEEFFKEAMGPESAWMLSEKKGEDNLDVAVLRSIIMLTAGNPGDFVRYQLPPVEIRDWIEKASLAQVHGSIIMMIRRWHELRQPSS